MRELEEMTQNAEAPTNIPSTQQGIIRAIAEFDWLKIPGAVRALSSIVIGAGDAGAAWLDIIKAIGEQKAREVRDTTEVRSKTLGAYTQAAIASGLKDAVLVNRAIEYTLVKGLREQKSREQIAIEAAGIVAESPPAPDTPPPDEDWLNVFSAFAEKASSARLRAHWAAVLAGEIKRPGRFSYAALHTFSLLDPRAASLIEKVRGWTFDDDSILMTPSKSRGSEYTDLMELSYLGLISLGHSRTYPPCGVHVRKLGDSWINMSFPSTIQVKTAFFSRAGLEILSLATPKTDEAVVNEVISYLTTLGVKDLRKL